MHIKKFLTIALSMLTAAVAVSHAGTPIPLDSCRSMALRNNKTMQIAQERINAAEYQKKQAFAAYLPGIDFAGGYMYNQKEISLLSGDQMLPTKTFNPATGTYDFNLLTGPDGRPVQVNGQYVPTQVALIPKEAMTFDIHNLFAGAVTLTQPIYMGGKIRALNKMAEMGQEIASLMHDNTAREVVYSVDAAYWQIVSLGEKKKLAVSYIELLDTLHSNVEAMIRQGIATNSDLLNVEVKLNEANIDLTKVDNGLALSRMALAQICGMPMTQEFTLADEVSDHKSFGAMQPAAYTMQDVYNNRSDLLNVEVKLNEANIDLTKVDNGLALSRMALAQICGMPMTQEFTLADEVSDHKSFGAMQPAAYTMQDVYNNRSDIKSLELAVKVYEQKQYEARSSMLPTVALVGTYGFSNPNIFNGFDKKFNGMFSVGAMVKIPLWHWGGNYYKYKAARSESIVKSLELEEAKEKIELQVSQASYKTAEAAKTLRTTESNLSKADENLRQAQLGYKEGVMTLDNVMAAQTAWLKANSENIDAEIDVQLCNVYLSKVTGTLKY